MKLLSGFVPPKSRLRITSIPQGRKHLEFGFRASTIVLHNCHYFAGVFHGNKHNSVQKLFPNLRVNSM